MVAVFEVVAEPSRRRILDLLRADERAVGDLVDELTMSQPAVSKHLRVLERAGLISRGREAQWRPSRLNAEPLKEATAWLIDYRKFWEGSFDRLDELLETLKARKAGPDSH